MNGKGLSFTAKYNMANVSTKLKNYPEEDRINKFGNMRDEENQSIIEAEIQSEKWTLQDAMFTSGLYLQTT